MKFFVTGAGGQLGYDVMNELKKRGYETIGSDAASKDAVSAGGEYVQLDITKKGDVERVIQAVHPDAVIHCAAWTDVDMAEDEYKLELVRAVNVYGTQNIADVCKKMDVKMTYLSTDYVFDGEGTKPWEPDCESYRPLNVYGHAGMFQVLC